LTAHPSKDIVGSESTRLKDKRVVLCITGSVAAVQCPEIARRLMREGAEVLAVMSSMAKKIIHPYLMEWATGNPVVTELTGKIEHVALVGKHPEKADLVLIAPATANTISKIACGIDDTPVTSVVSTALGSETPIIIVPAMHESMYKHPILSKNIQKLESLKVEFIAPRLEEGKAKIAETSEIVEAVSHKLGAKQDFPGLKMLITAGPTVEYIDPIRVITNRSTGKMGVAVTEEALNRGAEVTLVYGLGKALTPKGAHTIPVETTKQMHEAVISELKSTRYDVVIAVAAAADWTPHKMYKHKISTHKHHSLTLKLKPTKKIINSIKKISPETFLVAFRAHYKLSEKDLVESAYERLLEANADLIVVNDVSKRGVGFGTETNEVLMIDKKKEVVHTALASKEDIAKEILDLISKKKK